MQLCSYWMRLFVLVALVAPTVCLAQATGEREVQLESPGMPGGTLFDALGLSRPELGGLRLSAFVVGSFSYNSHLQMVPEFAGSTPALADPGSTNFRFDKFGLRVAKTFAPWLSASASFEVESHRDQHSHGFDPDFGCPGPGPCMERFGAEEASTETNLDRFQITAIAPLGNGVAFSFGRFDVPFGIERHDEPLLLTATTSEVFRFGRPQRMTGGQVSYAFTPWLDTSVWVVNRWESETTEDDFNDNNRDKSVGARIGFTPLARQGLLNFGIGAFFGPEQDENNANQRWVIAFDATWSPLPRLLVAGELVYGQEENVTMRERGGPIAAPASGQDVTWWGLYVLIHYEVVDWLGGSFRYGYFDDQDGGRTGVAQWLQSWTFVPIVHLSRLIPNLRPTGATYPRTRLPVDWVDLKVEYRLNHSNRPVFSDAAPGVDIVEANKTSHQVQLQLVVNF
jgi:hypothetical protein